MARKYRSFKGHRVDRRMAYPSVGCRSRSGSKRVPRDASVTAPDGQVVRVQFGPRVSQASRKSILRQVRLQGYLG